MRKIELMASVVLVVMAVQLFGCAAPNQGGKEVISAADYKAHQKRKDAHEDSGK